tara:strand:- start:4353 stop:4940 length:588 start_codon:yes stop_codon:yes gene_type:complete
MKVSMLEYMQEELKIYLKEYGYKHGDVILSSGKTSMHYLNCKPIILRNRGIKLASTLLLAQVEEGSVAVAGLTLGADPLVCGVAYESKELDALIVRKEAKGHGTQAWIEGPIHPIGSKVTVLEDVITTGGSAIKAATRLRDMGYEVNRIVCIVDRQEDKEADEFMEANNLELVSLFTLQEILDCSPNISYNTSRY